MSTRDMDPQTSTPARSARLLLILTIVFALVAAACGGDDDDGVVAGDDGTDEDGTGDGEEPADTADPFGTDEWVLISATVDGEPLVLLDTHPVTLRVDASGGVGGTAACNSYFGTLVDGDTLFDGFGVTEMACDPPESMDLELAFLDALGRTTRADLDDTALVLTGDGVELRFDVVAPTPDAQLVGTVWLLDTILTGDAASSILADTNPQFELDGDEMVAFDGCNTLAGGYELDGDVLRTGALRATTRGCPEAVATQATRFSSVLTGGPTLEIEGDHLTMTLPDGSGLRFTAT